MIKTEATDNQNKSHSAKDIFSLAFTTFGVGYIPIAPGTWGSAVGVLIYFALRQIETELFFRWSNWFFAVNGLILLLFCLVGIWASTEAVRLFSKKDPQKVIVDEIMGQLITFCFVPFAISWKLVLAGFLLFRLFDIWKPYPIRTLEVLPNGLGICADDILGGVYAGICLAIIYAMVVF